MERGINWLKMGINVIGSLIAVLLALVGWYGHTMHSMVHGIAQDVAIIKVNSARIDALDRRLSDHLESH